MLLLILSCYIGCILGAVSLIGCVVLLKKHELKKINKLKNEIK